MATLDAAIEKEHKLRDDLLNLLWLYDTHKREDDSPTREYNLLQMLKLISRKEKQLESLLGVREAKQIQEEIFTEEIVIDSILEAIFESIMDSFNSEEVTDCSEDSSIPSEATPDDSVDELVIPSFLFAEEKVDSQITEIAKAEVNDVDRENHVQMKEVSYEILESLRELITTHSELNCKDFFTLLIDFTRSLFDRGKKIELSLGNSYFAKCYYEFGSQFDVYLKILDGYYRELVLELIHKHGYWSDSLYSDQIAYMLAKGCVTSAAWQVFGKMLQIDVVNFKSKLVINHQLFNKKSSYPGINLTGSVFDCGRGIEPMERYSLIDSAYRFYYDWLFSYDLFVLKVGSVSNAYYGGKFTPELINKPGFESDSLFYDSVQRVFAKTGKILLLGTARSLNIAVYFYLYFDDTCSLFDRGKCVVISSFSYWKLRIQVIPSFGYKSNFWDIHSVHVCGHANEIRGALGLLDRWVYDRGKVVRAFKGGLYFVDAYKVGVDTITFYEPVLKDEYQLALLLANSFGIVLTKEGDNYVTCKLLAQRLHQGKALCTVLLLPMPNENVYGEVQELFYELHHSGRWNWVGDTRCLILRLSCFEPLKACCFLHELIGKLPDSVNWSFGYDGVYFLEFLNAICILANTLSTQVTEIFDAKDHSSMLMLTLSRSCFKFLRVSFYLYYPMPAYVFCGSSILLENIVQVFLNSVMSVFWSLHTVQHQSYCCIRWNGAEEVILVSVDTTVFWVESLMVIHTKADAIQQIPWKEFQYLLMLIFSAVFSGLINKDMCLFTELQLGLGSWGEGFNVLSIGIIPPFFEELNVSTTTDMIVQGKEKDVNYTLLTVALQEFLGKLLASHILHLRCELLNSWEAEKQIAAILKSKTSLYLGTTVKVHGMCLFLLSPSFISTAIPPGFPCIGKFSPLVPLEGIPKPRVIHNTSALMLRVYLSWTISANSEAQTKVRLGFKAKCVNPCQFLIAPEEVKRLHHSIVDKDKNAVEWVICLSTYQTGGYEETPHLYLVGMCTRKYPLFSF